ncbi:MAG: sigma-70 family RNA polymerase sigma factor [Polyangiaceae bacterium]
MQTPATPLNAPTTPRWQRALAALSFRDVVPYFYRSLQNAIGKWRAHSRRWCPLEPELPPPALTCTIQDSLVKQAVQQELEAAVNLSLCDLDSESRRILVMRFWENLTHAEIGQQLNINAVAARKRFSRALEELKSRLQSRCR